MLKQRGFRTEIVDSGLAIDLFTLKRKTIQKLKTGMGWFQKILQHSTFLLHFFTLSKE